MARDEGDLEHVLEDSRYQEQMKEAMAASILQEGLDVAARSDSTRVPASDPELQQAMQLSLVEEELQQHREDAKKLIVTRGRGRGLHRTVPAWAAEEMIGASQALTPSLPSDYTAGVPYNPGVQSTPPLPDTSSGGSALFSIGPQEKRSAMDKSLRLPMQVASVMYHHEAYYPL